MSAVFVSLSLSLSGFHQLIRRCLYFSQLHLSNIGPSVLVIFGGSSTISSISVQASRNASAMVKLPTTVATSTALVLLPTTTSPQTASVTLASSGSAVGPYSYAFSVRKNPHLDFASLTANGANVQLNRSHKLLSTR
jgi:hypothetical protein